MFFKRDTSHGNVDLKQVAVSVFGDDIIVKQSGTFLVKAEFPLLGSFAQNAECDYFVSGEYNKLKFSFYFPLKIYNTIRDKRIRHWAFWGSCLILHNDGFHIRSTFAFSGKPFRKPIDSTWQNNGKTQGVSIWSESQKLSADDSRVVQTLIKWLSREVSSLWTTRYAFQISDGNAIIAFWEPDLYDSGSQLKMLAEILNRFSLT